MRRDVPNGQWAAWSVATARAISVVGHPVVLMPVAGLVAASTRGASVRQLWWIGGLLIGLGVIVLGFSWLQVRTGRWSHVDASVQTERTSLNAFLAAMCFASATALWFSTHRSIMPTVLGLAGALVVVALALSRWVKVSLHTAFAAFATVLLWPGWTAVVGGCLVTVLVAWSRLVLRRHVVADVIAGLLLGVGTGLGYQRWVA